MKDSGAPGIGDIVTALYPTERTGLVVKERGLEVGIQYFKSSRMKGIPADRVWWVARQHVRIVSPALNKSLTT